jgi:hypothetical protein
MRGEWKMKQSSLAAPLRKSGRGVVEREKERVKDEAIIISCTLEKEWERSCRMRLGECERAIERDFLLHL